MVRERWYTVVAVLGLLIAAGAVAWRTWSGTSAGQFDPVGAPIALVGLAVSVVALGQGVRAQHQADTDVVEVARRLAVRVGQAETEARRQLLGGHDRTIDVGFDFVPAAAHNAAGAAGKGTLEEVLDYYSGLRPRQMVITGVGGSGKTVLAIELILGLLRERAADAPVPVRMSAARLDTHRPPESAVRDWVVEHLRQAYRLPKVAARELVAAGMVLPVLDGLDEMDALEQPGYASRAAHTIRACNTYLDGGRKAALVLTCRIDQYQALEQASEWVMTPPGFSCARLGSPWPAPSCPGGSPMKVAGSRSWTRCGGAGTGRWPGPSPPRGGSPSPPPSTTSATPPPAPTCATPPTSPALAWAPRRRSATTCSACLSPQPPRPMAAAIPLIASITGSVCWPATSMPTPPPPPARPLPSPAGPCREPT